MRSTKELMLHVFGFKIRTDFHFQIMDPERLNLARATLATEPYNLESWEVITRDAQTRKIEEARDIFEEIVEFFPTSGKFWKIYIEQEVNTF